ncbi:MAG: thermonuclease family protein [Candidatus Kapaibacterium sp.]
MVQGSACLASASAKSRAVTKQDCIEHLSNLIKGKTVVLEADTLVVDKNGKTLQRYVYLDGTLINMRMISDGYAAPSKTSHSLKAEFGNSICRCQILPARLTRDRKIDCGTMHSNNAKGNAVQAVHDKSFREMLAA